MKQMRRRIKKTMSFPSISYLVLAKYFYAIGGGLTPFLSRRLKKGGMMRKKILTLALICLLMLAYVLSAKEKGHINFWQKLFTEPVETIYFIMEDGVGFRHSNQYERIIYLNVEKLEKRLKTPEKIYKIKDIAIVIHNHFEKARFSDSDYRQYRALKKRGFNGRFLLYCRRTNKTYCIEDKKKDPT